MGGRISNRGSKRVFGVCRRCGAGDGKARDANEGKADAAARGLGEPGCKCDAPCDGEVHPEVEGVGTNVPRHPMELPAPGHAHVSRVGCGRAK